MASLAKLKESLIAAGGKEEKVEVNQRHLIDKILARYSAEFTVYRELLQNSNDAGATEAQIIFHVDASKVAAAAGNGGPLNLFSGMGGSKNAKTVTAVEYKNNGRPFSGDDWRRLRSIAEGNPDEQKIGFFGVGFYSLFSIAEEPLVTSGNECMVFFWKGDQLFTKTDKLDEKDVTQWTTFYLALREPIEAPEVQEFGRFLATSVAFTNKLRKIEVFFNDQRVLYFDKKVTDPQPLPLPRSTYTVNSPNNIFTLESINVKQAQMDVVALLEFDVSKMVSQGTPDTRQTKESHFNLFMRTAAGEFKVRLSDAFIKEMERTTKKRPPLETSIQLMFSNYDEYENSSGLREKNSMFDDLIPSPKDQGRIFIGFPTHQTTGCAIQMAAHLIPTVERESIDFVDKTLNIFNQEVLSMGGLLARIIYDEEMKSIDRMYQEMSLDEAANTWLQKRGSHAMMSFSFKPTTPAALVGRLISTYFYKFATKPMEIMSTVGVRPATVVRLPDPSMAGFLKRVPTISDEVMKNCDIFVKHLQTQGWIKPVTLDDVFEELGSRVFTELEMVALMRWWIDFRKRVAVTSTEIEKLLKLAKFTLTPNSTLKDKAGEWTLSQIKHHFNPKIFPPDLPRALTVLPLEIGKSFAKYDLESAFGGWTELSVLDWMRHIVKLPEFASDPAFIERALSVCSKQYRTLSNENRIILFSLLTTQKCIPTTTGLCVPQEAYFRTVTLFGDLPVVTLSHKNVSDDFLRELGVREHVELQVVFDRLSDLNWDHMQLIKYLSNVQNKLTEVELGRLKLTPLFPTEPPGGYPHLINPEPSVTSIVSGITSSSSSTPSLFRKLAEVMGGSSRDSKDAKQNSSSSSLKSSSVSISESEPATTPSQDTKVTLTPSTKRYKASELYPPDELFRSIGLPIIDWKVRWRPTSEEAKFLMKIGLNAFVPLESLLDIIAKAPSPAQRMKTINYLVDNLRTTYIKSYRPGSVNQAFLPTTDGSLAKPSECFSTPGCAILGFKILVPDLKEVGEKLGVASNPPPRALVSALLSSPPTLSNAKEIFEYLASRQSDFAPEHWSQLKSSSFIPVQKGKRSDEERNSPVVLAQPTRVYFGSSGSYYHDYFDYVDFGTAANTFLRSCGVKDEPSPAELANQLVRTPQQMLESAGMERYLAMLRQIAANYYMLKHQHSLLSEMRNSAFLIGVREAASTAEPVGDAETPPQLEYKLAKAREIHLIDDTILNQIFAPLGAPMESLLEEMYQDLGSLWLSTQVQEVFQPRGNPVVTSKSSTLQQTIRERAPLLTYDGTTQRSKDLTPEAERLLQKLEVREVPEIIHERRFVSVVKSQRTTSCLMMDKRTGTYYLLIAGEYDYFDVASALAKLIFRKARLTASLLLSTLLSTSLENLKRKGYPVDRILNLTANKLKEAALLKEQQRIKQQKELQIQLEAQKMKEAQQKPEEPSRAPDVKQSEAHAPVAASSASTLTETASSITQKQKENSINAVQSLPKDAQSIVEAVQSMFPDADMSHVKNLVESQGLKPGALNSEAINRAIQNISNSMLDKGYPKGKTDDKPPPLPDRNDELAVVSTSKDDPQQTEGLGRLFNRIGKNLGLWETAEQAKQGTDYNGRSSVSNGPGSGVTTKGNPLDQINQQYVDSLKRHLSQSLQTLKSSRDSAFRAEIPGDPPRPPPGTLPQNSLSDVTCSIIADNDLVLHPEPVGAGASKRGIPFYIDKHAVEEVQSRVINTPEGREALRRFAYVLNSLAEFVFGVQPGIFHIYYDHRGETVAFNKNRALFFNARYYIGLHFKQTDSGRVVSTSSGGVQVTFPGSFFSAPPSQMSTTSEGVSGPPQTEETEMDAYCYWFMVCCHELGHNFVSEHNSQHEFYMSSFAQNYMRKLIQMLEQKKITP
ncbi:hypothetical protein BJ742DRAFT_828538 [Cladochytrium replicatum]|nr:hypothetical protein BJ742DRAFT_828538 [Cladochytrium replicatum]